jgi:hypothetical protein
MNGPLFAAVLVAGVSFFLAWCVFLMMREPSRLVISVSFLIWFLPLYYFGAWASGNDFRTATIVLFFLTLIFCFELARTAVLDWQLDQIRPEGDEEEVVNKQSGDLR